jgi:acetylornithine deacetylase/succinyl-diaminopimelate desuccinylase-like protein
MYETFDFPEPSETKGVREVTTVPTQALFMMNSRFVIGQARNAAAHLLEANLATPQDRITRVYREVLGRVPTPAECNRALIFIHNAQEEAASQAPAPEPDDAATRRAGRRPLFGAAGRPGRGGRGPAEPPLSPVTPEISAWEHFYQALFASAEFRYRS